ncbi:MAG: LytTR family DNA-binding domain-containing protein [Bacteroidota bacterium]
MKITCLIIDDELPARQGLAALLEDYPDIELLESCADGVQAIDAIRAHRPDFVLLDVQMPYVNGFEVLESIPPPIPQVIFITAHDEFALRAFEVNAVDYLLKPFSDERFDQAMARVVDKLKYAREDQGIRQLLQSSNLPVKSSRRAQKYEGRLLLKSDGNVHLLPHNEVVFVEAYDYYIKVHLEDRFLLVRETMKNIELLLPAALFVRIHKSYIVNVRWVRALRRVEAAEHSLELTDGKMLRVSRGKLPHVRERLGAI